MGFDPPMEGDFSSVEGAVCRECINDPGLIKVWKRGKRTRGRCKYCKQRRALIEINELIPTIQQFIGVSYSLAVEESPWVDGEYFAQTYDSSEVMSYTCEGDVSDELYQDLLEASDDSAAYCDRDWALLRPTEILRSGWNEFTEVVKHRRRYFFHRAKDESKDLRGAMEIPPGRFLYAIKHVAQTMRVKRQLEHGERFFRICRFDSKTEKSSIVPSRLWSPPAEHARYANRFSPAGISMFYGSRDKNTAIAETGGPPRKGEFLAIGSFKLRKPIDVVDWTRAKRPEGQLDPDWIGRYHLARFFDEMVEDMAKPVKKDGREHIDYVPTQVVSEYIRTSFRTAGRQCLGMVYGSAVRSGGMNAVLFLDHAECEEYLDCEGIGFIAGS